MKTSTITDGIETTLRSLAPIDLADDQPFYVVLQSNAPPSDLLLTDCIGSFHRCYDLTFQSWLESCGRWLGRGPLLVVNDLLIRDYTPDEDDADNVIFGVAIHELAHAINVGFDLTERTAAEVALIELRALLAINRLNVAPPYTPPQTDLPWRGHDAHYIRVAGHLVFRAKRQGLAVELDQAVNFSQYGLRSSGDEYFYALTGEFERFADAPLSTLRNHQPPAAFVWRWRNDLADWCSQEPDDAKAALAFADLDLFS